MNTYPIMEFYLENLAEELKENGSPINSQEAEKLWRALSSTALSTNKSKILYLKAGYIPFSGFPLTRKG